VEIVTRDQANEHQAKQLADFLRAAGLLGVRSQDNLVSYPTWGGDLVIVRIQSAPLVPDQPLRAAAEVAT
jgi:hypothetical protein